MRIHLVISLFIHSLFFSNYLSANENDIYKKIDLFGEVLEKINEEYVDEINQSDSMDSAINGLLQSLDPYSAYMSPKIFNEMQTETSGEFGGLGIEVGMEAGVVKVISPIDDTPASRAGLKAGDYIVKIEDTQVQGKSLSEAVDLMRGWRPLRHGPTLWWTHGRNGRWHGRPRRRFRWQKTRAYESCCSYPNCAEPRFQIRLRQIPREDWRHRQSGLQARQASCRCR